MDLIKNKDIIRNVFIALLSTLLILIFLRQGDPFLFPGLEERLFWVSLIFGILTFVLYLPNRKPKLKEEEFRKNFLNIAFQFILVLFLISLLVREFISIEFVNMNYFMITVLIFGILTIIFPAKTEKQKEKVKKRDYFLILFFGILGSLLIWYKTQDIGYLSYVISIISGVLIILLSILVLEE